MIDLLSHKHITDTYGLTRPEIDQAAQALLIFPGDRIDDLQYFTRSDSLQIVNAVKGNHAEALAATAAAKPKKK